MLDNDPEIETSALMPALENVRTSTRANRSTGGLKPPLGSNVRKSGLWAFGSAAGDYAPVRLDEPTGDIVVAAQKLRFGGVHYRAKLMSIFGKIASFGRISGRRRRGGCQRWSKARNWNARATALRSAFRTTRATDLNAHHRVSLAHLNFRRRPPPLDGE